VAEQKTRITIDLDKEDYALLGMLSEKLRHSSQAQTIRHLIREASVREDLEISRPIDSPSLLKALEIIEKLIKKLPDADPE